MINMKNRIVKLIDTIHKIEELKQKSVHEYEVWNRRINKLKYLLSLSDNKLDAKVKKDYGKRDVQQVRKSLERRVERFSKWMYNYGTQFYLLTLERDKYFKIIESENSKIGKNDKQKLDREFQYEICREEVERIMKKKHIITKEEAFFIVAENLGKSFEAVKGSYYHRGKLQRKSYNSRVT